MTKASDGRRRVAGEELSGGESGSGLVDAEMTGAGAGQWGAVAERWALLGPPLRPDAEDVENFQRAVDEVAGRMAVGRAVILGVTPELWALRWPAGTEVRAVDRSPEMIAGVWPGDPCDVIVGDWTVRHFGEGSVQVVLCDGGLQLLDYPDGQAGLFAVLKEVIPRGGRAVFRLFQPPEERLSPDEVLSRLEGGQIADMNMLKPMLWHAFAGEDGGGVCLHDIWEFLDERIADRGALFRRLGWDPDKARVIDCYRGVRGRYWFPDLGQIRAVAGSVFRFRAVPVGGPVVMLHLERV